MAKRDYITIEESKDIERFSLVTNKDGRKEIWLRIAVYDKGEEDEAISDFTRLGLGYITPEYLKIKMERKKEDYNMESIKIKKISLEEAKKLGIDSWSHWECEPSTFDWEYDEQETAYVFEGDVIVTTPEQTVHITDNMLVSFPKGLKCTWEVRKKIRKVYTFNFEI
ncbi:cupin domain-containing protein [Caloranaerobacter ferrireducens]|uniref:cupin domain-containing protein n=1 Tax=Caloranaerobacter ferrireducens TaxID=1323370 RepID=UPI001FA733B4|nr:cupin domain-containing protein [Caloranaerobacter ferrireducens]